MAIPPAPLNCRQLPHRPAALRSQVAMPVRKGFLSPEAHQSAPKQKQPLCSFVRERDPADSAPQVNPIQLLGSCQDLGLY